jgi:hypothetical protein
VFVLVRVRACACVRACVLVRACAGGRSQRTLFSIRAGNAADLRAYSAFAGEEELLMPAGTVFEVLNVKRMARSPARRRGRERERQERERGMEGWREGEREREGESE